MSRAFSTRHLTAIVLTAACIGNTRADVPCELEPTFTFHHTFRRENFAVQIYEVRRSGKAVAFWAPRFAVNTDATPKSYSLDDPDGLQFALNSLRNGFAKKKCEEGKFTTIVNRLRQLRDQGWPRDSDQKLIDKSIIDCLSADVFPRAPSGEPCPEVNQDGRRFLVSGTALFNEDIKDVCNPLRYVDSMRIPAVVLPLDKRFNGLNGNFALAWYPERRSLVLTVVGDRGPGNELGEGSIALNAKLLGVTKMPGNRRAVERTLHISTPVFVMVLEKANGRASAFKAPGDFLSDAEAAWRSWIGTSTSLTDVVSACAQAASRPK